jgi:uncharacterized protein YndB with AHSA1/START domain
MTLPISCGTLGSMTTLHFETTIRATREQVWNVMLAADTYREWTAEFAEGSYYEGSWGTGDRIRFLGPGGQGGMVAVIAESRPPEFLSIKHIGEVKDGVEDTESEAVRRWAPAFENYTLSDAGSATLLAIDIDVAPEWSDYMAEHWPRALARLAAICEEQPNA